MATIVTRAGKGSPLTNTECDANITNLNTDKIENIVEDTTPQLGGNLSTNGNDIIFDNNDQARFGSGGGQGSLVISATATESTIAEAGSGDLTVKADTFKVTNANGLEDMLIATPDAGVALYHNDVKKLETTSGGATVTGALTTTGGVAATGDVLTFGNIQVVGTVDGRDVAADGATLDAVASTYVDVSGDTLTGDLAFGDNVKAKFGASDDLQIYHDGSHSYIKEVGTGNLRFDADNWYVRSADGSEAKIAAITNGAVSLYYDGTAKLATTSTGIDVTGTVTADGATIDGTLNVTSNALNLNASSPAFTITDSDTSAYHVLSGASGYGSLFLTVDAGSSGAGGGFFIQRNANTRSLSISNSTGDISFYEDTGTTAKLTWDASTEELQFKDNVAAEFGSDSDFRILHNGTNAKINCNTGALQVTNFQDNADIILSTDDGSGGTANYFRADGSTGEAILYHYGSQKLATKSTGIDVTGTVVADGLTVGSVSSSSSSDLGVLGLKSDTNHKAIMIQENSGAEQYEIGVDADGSLNFYNSGSTSPTVKIDDNNDVSFYNAALTTADFRWDSSTSRLGLGTTSPQEELDISSTNPAVRLSDTTTSGLYHRVVSSSNNLYLESDAGNVAASSFIGFRTDGVEHMRLTSDRRLGIGITTPLADLHVSNASGSEVRIDTYGGANADSVLNFREQCR